MAAGFRFLPGLLITVLSLAVMPLNLHAACTLNKDTSQLSVLERNIATLDRVVTSSDGKRELSSIKSEFNRLKQQAAAFPGQAAPIEQECQAVSELGRQLKVMKQQRDTQLKGIDDQIRANKEEYDRVIVPRAQALRDELASLKSQGCYLGQKNNDIYKRCHGPEVDWERRSVALKADARRYQQRHERLVSEFKRTAKPYGDALQKGKARYEANKQQWESYNRNRSAWNSDLKALWNRGAQLYAEAQNQQQRAVHQAPASKPKGGEIGKLSGPMATGKPGRSPDSKALPKGALKTDGTAKGQARAAAKTGAQGVQSGSDSEASFKAGRVFDRGDVQGGGGGGDAVDARGVQAKEVPEAVRQNPRWQALDKREQQYRAEQQQVQQKIDTIKQKIQSGEGDKGKLQVELVHERDKMDRIQSQVNVIKVEKESFEKITIEEKPAKAPAKE